MALDLPIAERTAVFRAMVQVLRADPIVSRVCRHILAWEGKPTDANPLTAGMGPSIRITPTGEADVFLSPSSMKGPLVLNLEILVPGYNVDDLMNLWRAIGAAYYAPTNTTFAAIQAVLRGAGAFPPEPLFTQPAFDAAPESGFLYALSKIQITVLTNLGSRGANTTT